MTGSASRPTSALDLAAIRWNADGLVPVVAQDIGSGAVLMLAWADREAVERTLATGLAWFWSRSRRRLWQKGETSGNVLRVAGVAADCDGDTLLYRVDAEGPACHRGTRTCFEGGGFEDRGSEEGGSEGGDDGAPRSRANAGAALELGWLAEVIAERRGADPAASYTARLLAAGIDRAARKVGEEATEVVIAALRHDAAVQLDLHLDRARRDHRPGSETALLGTATLDTGGPPRGGDGAGNRGQGTAAALAGEAADLLYHLLVLLEAGGVPPGAVAAELRRRHARPATPATSKPEDAAGPEETTP